MSATRADGLALPRVPPFGSFDRCCGRLMLTRGGAGYGGFRRMRAIGCGFVRSIRSCSSMTRGIRCCLGRVTVGVEVGWEKGRFGSRMIVAGTHIQKNLVNAPNHLFPEVHFINIKCLIIDTYAVSRQDSFCLHAIIGTKSGRGAPTKRDAPKIGPSLAPVQNSAIGPSFDLHNKIRVYT